MLSHSGFIFCHKVEIHKMTWESERFDTVNSAWLTHTLRTIFVFLTTLRKNYSYWISSPLQTTLFMVFLLWTVIYLFTMYVDYRVLYICLLPFCTDYLVAEKTGKFLNLVFILYLNWAITLSTGYFYLFHKSQARLESVRQLLCKSLWV